MFPTKLTPVADLVPHPNNPRTIRDEDFEKLCVSLEEDFNLLWANPVVASDRGKGELVIISGEKRYYAALELELAEVPVCAIPNLSEDDEKRIMIKFNTHAGKWDQEMLMEYFDTEKFSDWGLDLSFNSGEKKPKAAKAPAKVEMNVKHICPECGHKF